MKSKRSMKLLRLKKQLKSYNTHLIKELKYLNSLTEQLNKFRYKFWNIKRSARQEKNIEESLRCLLAGILVAPNQWKLCLQYKSHQGGNNRIGIGFDPSSFQASQNKGPSFIILGNLIPNRLM